MALGLLMLGMLVGAIASCYWIVTGGSFLVAFALYSLVATVIVLSAAFAAYLWSEFRAPRGDDYSDALPAAE